MSKTNTIFMVSIFLMMYGIVGTIDYQASAAIEQENFRIATEKYKQKLLMIECQYKGDCK